ncbi:unnamed protein product [Cercopithifilaria johnstoni]|uniref:Uncharacterized protein n=1 Tax=Cercopithifilaria johnstoni TaxID=2874296 RepID=A0A8J2PQN6_9BILA|nr:unnamed protein product [Cercopithifilaria johnstoni]
MSDEEEQYCRSVAYSVMIGYHQDLFHYCGKSMRRSDLDPGNSSHNCTSSFIFRIITEFATLDNAIPPSQRIFNETGAAAPTIAPTASTYGTSIQNTIEPINNVGDNCGPIIMYEKVPSRKIGITAPYMSTNVHFSMIMKGSYSTQIYKDGLATANDYVEQRVNSSDGSGNNLTRYRSYDFKPLHVESPLHVECSSKRFPISEQRTFDIALNIPQFGFMDTTNRGYTAKSTIAPFSMKPAIVGQNSFINFVKDEYGTMRAQVNHMRQADNFNYELSMSAISRKFSNEYNRSGHRNSQEGISGEEYRKRLLQAHQIVDELLKSRGLISENEIDYLQNWRQKMNREPKVEERNAVDVSDPVASKNAESLDTSEASQQHSISNASDSGLSMDADSENDLRGSPKLQELNSQNLIITDLLPFKKQETTLVKSIEVNIAKVKKHKNVCLKVIIKWPQHCWLYMDMKIRLEKKEATSEKTTSSNKGLQMVGDQMEGHTSVKSNEKDSFTQNRRLNQDHKMEIPTELSTISNRESTTAKSNNPKTVKKHNISKPKCEAVNVCYCFVNNCCLDKAIIALSIALCATVKQNIAVSGKKFLDRTEKELKSKCNKDNLMHSFFLAKTGKLTCNMKMFPELQNMEKTSKIRVAQKEGHVVESKAKVTEIEKDVVDFNKTEKLSKFPVLIKESPKKLKATEEGANLVSVLHTKKITPNQTRKTFTSKQVTLSKNLCLKSKLSQSEATMTVPLRSHKIKITKRVMVQQMTDNKKYQREELLKTNNPSIMKKKECLELKKTQKTLQNYITVTSKYYQKTPRSITKNESNAMTEFERNEDIDIRRAREHLRRINFSRTGVRLESSASSFVHRINEDPVKLSDKSTTSLGTSSEQSSSVLSIMKKKAKKKISGMKMDKGSNDRPVGGTHTASIEKERCQKERCDGRIVEPNNDILDRELINAYRRTQRIPKPQAKIPAWNVYDERKLEMGTTWNPPKLRHEILSTTVPVPCFIRARTPAADVATTLSTPIPAIAVLHHVSENHLPVMAPRLKKVLSSDSSITIADSLQQHTPSSQFGVTLKRVDRVTVQKSKARGAITQSAPKKPWVPKWRRIQRTEEEDEAETIPVVEMNRDEQEHGDEQEAKQMTKQLSSQVATQKNGKDMTEAEKAMMVAKRRQIEDETAKLQKYEEKRRIERKREEEELKKLKEKKERRKLERKEEERQFQERLKQEEERRKQEEEERKAKMEAEKRKKEDEKRKRQQMLSSRFTNTTPGHMGRNFIIPQKSDKADKFGNIVQAKHEMSMTKEQQEEAKCNYLVSVKHTIEFEKIGPAELREKIRQIHQRICKLEADKYDLEKRHERQEYDLRELNERQRQVARNKALEKGLDPADTNSKHPPKVSIVSKYDRQIDRRNFRERRAIFENKTSYPCFPNVPPPPTVYEKMILSYDKEDEEEDDEEEEE